MKAEDWIKAEDRLPEKGAYLLMVMKERHVAILGKYDWEGFRGDGKTIPNDEILCYIELVPPEFN